MATFIIAAIIGGLFLLAFRKSSKDLKENKCAGCSGNCTSGKCDIEI